VRPHAAIRCTIGSCWRAPADTLNEPDNGVCESRGLLEVAADLLMLTSRHLDDLDRRIAEFTRQRERVRTVEARLMS
jgi:hypothetical protein